MGRIIACTSLIASLSFGASGQVFEVASVRLNKSGIRGGSMEFSRGGERFTATNMPLGALILVAYDVTVRQLSGPDESFGEKYDVSAKAEYAVGADVRKEIKEVPVDALTIGKGGSKILRSKAPESAATLRTPARAGGTEPRSGHLIFKNESMPDFAWAQSGMAGIGDRVVVDQTGLKGTYDFELTFERDSAPSADAREPEPSLEGAPVFSALQEQLGLRLESKKALVEFLIVDHVERPSEN
jgi:hypothetical protein